MTQTDFDRVTDALTARLEALLKDHNALTRSLDAERDESARLLAAVARGEGENAALREALDLHPAAGEGLAALAGQIEVLTDQVARLAGAAHSGNGSFDVVPAHGRRNEAAEQLHAILTSRSWRMTRPIRGLGRVVRRFRG